MIKNLENTPWPWFGGKADATPAVWQALGDVPHYVEPFAWSLAVLLRRPHGCNRACPHCLGAATEVDNAWMLFGGAA